MANPSDQDVNPGVLHGTGVAGEVAKTTDVAHASGVARGAASLQAGLNLNPSAELIEESAETEEGKGTADRSGAYGAGAYGVGPYGAEAEPHAPVPNPLPSTADSELAARDVDWRVSHHAAISETARASDNVASVVVGMNPPTVSITASTPAAPELPSLRSATIEPEWVDGRLTLASEPARADLGSDQVSALFSDLRREMEDFAADTRWWRRTIPQADRRWPKRSDWASPGAAPRRRRQKRNQRHVRNSGQCAFDRTPGAPKSL